MINREYIEWCSYWIEKANEDTKRILIIGDSVMRQCRSSLNRLTQEKNYVVDVLSISYGIFDYMVDETIDSFLKNGYQYEYILFNLGGHHGFSWPLGGYDEQTYKQRLQNLLGALKDKAAYLFTISGLAENEHDSDKEVVKKNNYELAQRNRCLKQISDEMGVQYMDLNSLIKLNTFTYTDRQHFTKRDYEVMAVNIYNIMFMSEEKPVLKRLHSLEELAGHLQTKIYIYGDGERGGIVNDFLESMGKKPLNYIISDEFWETNSNKNGKIAWSEFCKLENGNQDLIIVTLKDEYPLCKMLWKKKMEYITLEDGIYNSMQEIMAFRKLYEL